MAAPDKEELKRELARIESQMASLAELKQQYLARLSVTTITELPANTTTDTRMTPEDKLSIFRSYFRGREDIYARRWENRSGRSGYSPACGHEWDRTFCRKPEVKCADCANRELLRFDKDAITQHLEGKIVVGIYPLLGNDSCFFLAMDFDGDGWVKDIAAIRETCRVEKVPAAVERSRSGDGGHVWIFFSDEVPASLARRLGTGLIAKTMAKHCQLGVVPCKATHRMESSGNSEGKRRRGRKTGTDRHVRGDHCIEAT